MAKIFWDTNLFIYLFEHNRDWSARVIELRRRMLARGDQLLTSYLSIGEVLTKPNEMKDSILEKSNIKFFSSNVIQLIRFDVEAAQWYAEIGSRERIRPADAIQLACASAAGTDLFVTSDARLCDLVAPGITFITGIARIPY
ncbi:MAG: PIN domain-containing protein [Bryobacterales bacterium]|nr:PIN domain-containing protein [Bryobacterales bacterium]MBV9399701.1 PIN domain-containing protein [Bryobacterales bacterium]